MPLDVEKHLSSASSVALSAGLALMLDTVLLVSQSTPLCTEQCTATKSRERSEVLKELGKSSSAFKRYSKSSQLKLPYPTEKEL